MPVASNFRFSQIRILNISYGVKFQRGSNSIWLLGQTWCEALSETTCLGGPPAVRLQKFPDLQDDTFKQYNYIKYLFANAVAKCLFKARSDLFVILFS